MIAVALTATAYAFIGPLQQGFDRMDGESRQVFKNGMREADGDLR